MIKVLKILINTSLRLIEANRYDNHEKNRRILFKIYI